MTVERRIAGAFVLLSLLPAHWWSPCRLLFRAFVGLNLFQSGLTNWCPMMALLRRLGVREHRAVATIHG
jgi:hypothetical protein